MSQHWKGPLCFLVIAAWSVFGCSDTSGVDDVGRSENADAGVAAPGAERPLPSAERLEDKVFVRQGSEYITETLGFSGRLGAGGLGLSSRDGSEPGVFVRVSRLGRDGSPSVEEAEASRLDDEGRVVIERPGATEIVERHGDEIEQSWRFDSEPSGDGDLVVEVAVEGVRLLEVNASGAHFEVPGSSVGLRYSHATWIDGIGARVDVPLSVNDGVISLRVPERVLEATHYPAILDPTIGGETAVDTPVTASSTSYDEHPEIAWGPSSGLVVWQAANSGAPTLWGIRVDTSGSPIDPIAFPIRTDEDARMPAVARGPDGWLVVWTGDPVSGSKDDIFARPVADNGTLGPVFPIQRNNLTEMSYPEVSFDGANYFVAWREELGLKGARVAPDGTLLNADVTVAASASPRFGLAYGGGVHVAVVAASGNELHVVRIGTDGVVIDATPIVLSSGVGYISPRIASSGTDFLVTWYMDMGGSEEDVLAMRLNADGTSPDMGPVTLVGTSSAQRSPRADWNGMSWTLAWHDYRDPIRTDPELYVQLFGADLSSTTTATVVAPMGNGSLALGTIAGETLIVFTDEIRDILARRIDNGGVFLDTEAYELSLSTNRERPGAVAYGGGIYLVVWHDSRPGADNSVYASRVSAAGVPMDDPPILVRLGAGNNGALGLAVDFDGQDFIVVWPEHYDDVSTTDLMGLHVGVDGEVVESTPFRLTSGAEYEYDPALTFDGTAHLLVFRKDGGAYATRIATDGSRLDASDIFLASYFASPPKVVRGADRFYATPHQFLIGTTPGPLSVTNSGRGADEHYRSVATNGSTFLLLTSDNIPTGLWATLFDATGGYLNHMRLEYADSRFVDAVWLGDSYYVVFTDWDSGPGMNLKGIEIDPSGNPVGLPEVIVPDWLSSDANPRVAVAGDGTALLSYARFDPALGTDRIYVRLLGVDKLPDGSSCVDAFECESGFCIDGACCDGACGGGTSADCLACSLAAGASADGVCGVVQAGRFCRPSAGLCDPGETCDGISVGCPTDTLEPDGTSCDADGDACDGVDSCSSGVCTPTAPLDCDDLDLCTADSCDPTLACINAPIAGCCVDPLDCDDGDLCTADACPVAGASCTFDPIPGCCNLDADCNDSDVCTTDSCPNAGGACVHLAIDSCCALDADCAPDDVCTVSSCNLATNHCVQAPIFGCCLADGDCDDGDLCTVDDCSGPGGSCSQTPIPGCCNLDSECDDGDICTTDSCPTAGALCSNVDVLGCCRAAADCDDGDSCTVDSCDAATGACSTEPDPVCEEPPPADEGCSCSAVGAGRGPGAPTSPAPALAFLVLLAYTERRRRRA